MYLFYETFSDTYNGSANQDSTLAFLNQLTHMHALFHGKSGKTFSAMRRVELYRISFQCLVTDYSAEHLFMETGKKDIEISLSDRITSKTANV